MYGIFTYIYHKNQPYTLLVPWIRHVHGSYASRAASFSAASFESSWNVSSSRA